MAEKKQDFVVSDRRRFGSEGELRTDIAQTEEEKERAAEPAAPSTPPPVSTTPPPPPIPPQTQQSPSAPAHQTPATHEGAAPSGEEEQELPAPPTPEEEHEQNEAYKASTKKLEQIFGRAPGGQRGPIEMTFERVIESFYMSALIQLGAIRQEGEPPSVDIIGARQTIDSLTILQEKTKGNLSDREQTFLQNVLFELRMAWIEITNAIAAGPPPGTGPGVMPPGGIKK
jgi:type IV secretory pathway VirB10-like protein